jgi:hypothetical protein
MKTEEDNIYNNNVNDMGWFDKTQSVLHSPFDIKTHEQTFTQYLEVCIDEEGVVHYAVPSHQEWLINKACEKLNISRECLIDRCPMDHMFSPLEWLTKISECIAVWDDHYVGELNTKQFQTLSNLMFHNLYFGDIKIRRDSDIWNVNII